MARDGPDDRGSYRRFLSGWTSVLKILGEASGRSKGNPFGRWRRAAESGSINAVTALCCLPASRTWRRPTGGPCPTPRTERRKQMRRTKATLLGSTRLARHAGPHRPACPVYQADAGRGPGKHRQDRKQPASLPQWANLPLTPGAAGLILRAGFRQSRDKGAETGC